MLNLRGGVSGIAFDRHANDDPSAKLYSLDA